jgi:YVTN family beta-propeller protein
LNEQSLRRRRLGGLATAGLLLVTAVATSGLAAAATIGRSDKVGDTNRNGVVLPDNQTIAPLGKRVMIDNGRLLASAMSPDDRTLAALTYRNGIGFLSLFDAKTGKVLQQIGTGAPGDAKIGDGTVAADGPLWSPDGRTLWVSQTSDLLKFPVNADGSVATAPTVIPMKDATRSWLPSGGAFNADGTKMYLALNNLNTLAVMDVATDTIEKQIPVGVAPRQVAVVDDRVYVSNEGGRPATADDFTNLTSGTPVVANAKTGAANNGSVSVVDPESGSVGSIKTGLQPTALYVHGTTMFVANSNDDSVTVIDTTTNKVAQTFNVNPLPGSTVGSYPNAFAMTDENHLLVSIGRDNALAVYRVDGSARTPVHYAGLVPTDWYPVGIAVNPKSHQVVVTNDKGIGTRGTPKSVSEGPDANTVSGPSTYSDTGTLTLFDAPTDKDLGKLTHTVFVNNGWQSLGSSQPISGAAAAKERPVAIPKELGAPSKIKHVFLLVKENRTYDQVFGDIGKGNSDATLTQFGASVTPNHHALANQFSLFDNFYDEGTLSADGHNWLMQADANDYIEKEFGAFYRSYPAQGGDALAYQRDGFLWNAVQAAGKTVRNFGEYNNFFTADDDPNRPTWAQWYQDALTLEGKSTAPLPVPVDKYRTYADIDSLNKITDPAYPKFDTDVPDQYRVDIWLKSFEKAEKTGNLANLNMLWVPDDHTAGTSGASPYPTAAVADNDLAVGRIVDKISHSRFWKDSAVFVVEDDSQAGVDHVDGHRAPILLASPYARHGKLNDTYYTQLNVVKTIEQILGVAPMNQEDRAAEPMYDAFTDTEDDAPFNVRPNQVPLTYGLKTPLSLDSSNGTNLSHGPHTQVPRRSASKATPELSPALSRIQAKWQVWSTHQNFGGAHPQEDKANPAQLNRLDWYSSTGWVRPYPGDSKILGPYQVPGWDKPAAELN